MKTIRTAIIDDEPFSADLLRHLVEKHCPTLELTGVYTNSENALQAILRDPVELLLLDIEMPRMNGFELLSRLPANSVTVIFTTAYDQYAVRAFKYSAVDYLMKPIDVEELKKAVDKAIHSGHVQRGQLDVLQQAHKSDAVPQRIALSTMDGLTFVDLRDIVHCESQSAYCYVHLADGRKILLSRHLKEISDILEPLGFIRVHNSHLIQPDYVAQYHRGEGGEIVLKNGRTIPVSRSKKQEFLDRIMKI